jgi:hypothetical protein
MTLFSYLLIQGLSIRMLIKEAWEHAAGIQKKCIFADQFFFLSDCGCGVIGSRARLRILCLTAWGFESLHPHENTGIITHFLYNTILDEHYQRKYRRTHGDTET